VALDRESLGRAPDSASRSAADATIAIGGPERRVG